MTAVTRPPEATLSYLLMEVGLLPEQSTKTYLLSIAQDMRDG